MNKIKQLRLGMGISLPFETLGMGISLPFEALGMYISTFTRIGNDNAKKIS